MHADGTSSRRSYDALGRVLSETDQAGLATTFAYDAAVGRLQAVTGALGQVTSYTYDELGSLLSQTDANLHTTTFEHDPVGRVVKRTLPEGQFETSSYDLAGNLVARRDFAGYTTTYAYDLRDRRLESVADPTHPSLVLSHAPARLVSAYDDAGRRSSQSVSSAAGDVLHAETYSYDGRDRLISKATPQGSLSYQYDAGGNPTRIASSNPGGVDLAYEYDELSRLSAVVDHATSGALKESTYAYDTVGNLSALLYPNGVETTYLFDSLNRLSSLSAREDGGPELASYQYTLGPAGNRLAVDELSGRSVTYSYDDLYRLTSETISGGSGPMGAISYTYDAVGNRLARTSSVAGVADQAPGYSPNDWLVSDAYDENGNTTASPGVSTSDVYDFRDHLIRRTRPDGAVIELLYNGEGERVSKTVTLPRSPPLTTAYLLDGVNPTGFTQVVEELQARAPVRHRSYSWRRPKLVRHHPRTDGLGCTSRQRCRPCRRRDESSSSSPP